MSCACTVHVYILQYTKFQIVCKFLVSNLHFYISRKWKFAERFGRNQEVNVKLILIQMTHICQATYNFFVFCQIWCLAFGQINCVQSDITCDNIS